MTIPHPIQWPQFSKELEVPHGFLRTLLEGQNTIHGSSYTKKESINVSKSSRKLPTNTLSTKYSLHFKIKVMFGHKLRYKLKVTFGEISLKLCETNWNVARINVNVVVVDKLPSQITIYNCLIIDIWT